MAGLLRRFGFGTVLRLGAAATLLAVALSVYGPRVVEERTREAVINARLEPVRAPVPGVLRRDLGPPGRAVRPGELLAAVEDPRVERARESTFAVELADARGRLAAVEAELARLAALDAGFEARRLRALDVRLLEAALARRQVEARLAAARAALAERRAHAERVRRLRAARAVPQEELEQAERILAEAETRVRELELERERALLSLRALARGTLLPGAEDVPYSRSRMDEVALRLGELARERDRLGARIRALGEALARERARREAEARAELRAPFHAVVWRRDVSAGAEVPRDQVLGLLLDCRTLYVTAIVHQRILPDLQPGLPAAARPFGESRWFPGRVVAVRAAPLVEEDGFAVLLRPLEEDEAVVLVELEAPELAADPARFCHVGRTVELALDRGVPVVSRLYRMVADLFRETGEAGPARAGQGGSDGADGPAGGAPLPTGRPDFGPSRPRIAPGRRSGLGPEADGRRAHRRRGGRGRPGAAGRAHDGAGVVAGDADHRSRTVRAANRPAGLTVRSGPRGQGDLAVHRRPAGRGRSDPHGRRCARVPSGPGAEDGVARNARPPGCRGAAHRPEAGR
ncbi:Chromosome partition protein Smc [bacterium HR39]|nr:Chromosome partition protein Smc [bacterium HR39]